ncbi:conserved hypothetical protein [Franzmannia pantelleriensis]|uniref:EthD domain-containing protein n=1 Tax=Franzmannia pantelleriensis TaxID=48727 RepID=A0A1G9JJJ9_9GAMM|nr:EthD family reductase [Halomonas pantelleriensis]SDL37263.1 conserved hypothetical protein [Halomonas pantelleriensis]
MIDVLLMYSNSNGMRFDYTYYLKEHASLLSHLLQPYGLNYICLSTGSDTASPFHAVTHLGMASLETFESAIDEIGSTFFEDIPRFTDVEPVIQVGNVVWERKMS